MRQLKIIQKDFLDSIKDPANYNFAKHLKVTERFTPERSTQVYKANYLGSLIKILNNTYPLSKKILGNALFEKIANDYIYNYPSYDSNLTYYGEHFLQFLKHEEIPFLNDFATLEWLYYLTFYASNHRALLKADLSADTVKLKLAPSIYSLISNHPLLELWKHYKVKDLPIDDLKYEMSLYVVWRNGENISMLKLDIKYKQFFTLLIHPHSFREVVGKLGTESEAVALGEFVNLAFQNGWFVKV